MKKTLNYQHVGEPIAKLYTCIETEDGIEFKFKKLSKGATMKKKYTFWHGLLDVILVFATGGLWLIWILIKFLRTH